MANANIDDELHEKLKERYEKIGDSVEFPSFKNMVDKMLRHSLSCKEFAGKHTNTDTR